MRCAALHPPLHPDRGSLRETWYYSAVTMGEPNWLLERLMYLIPLLLSLSVHEWAHAWSAFKLGDDTASLQGRLTLNPLAHMDPLGTFLLPLLGVPFGWAKPVPVNPARFRRDVSMRVGMMITAAAGPASNVVLALICALLYGLAMRFGLFQAEVAGGEPTGVEHFLVLVIGMNIGLAVFNLLPVPPLDGSRVVEGLVPYRYRRYWDTYASYGRFALIAVIFFGGILLVVPLTYAEMAIFRLVWWIAGVS